MKMDGIKSVLKVIRPYSTMEGKLTRDEFSGALLRLGLKIRHPENLSRAFEAFTKGGEENVLDMYRFASLVEGADPKDSKVDWVRVASSLCTYYFAFFNTVCMRGSACVSFCKPCCVGRPK